MKRACPLLVVTLACLFVIGGAAFAEEPGRSPEREAGPRKGVRETDGVSPEGKARPRKGARAAFLAGPVHSEQDAARLRTAVSGVRGLDSVTVQGGTERGTLLVSVTAPGEAGLRQAMNAVRGAGFNVRPLAKSLDGEGPAKGFGPREGEGARKPGPRDGERPEKPGPRDGEGPQKPGPRDGEDPQKLAPREQEPGGAAAEGRGTAYVVEPVRSVQEAVQLHQMLLRVPGVREVVVRPAERPNAALVVLSVAQKDALIRATRMMRGLRLQVRPMADGPREGGNPERGEGEGGPRPEAGERRHSPEARDKRPDVERER